MFRRLNTCGIILVLGLATIAGCGKAGPPPTASVTGTVTMGGQPVTSAEIYFVSSEKGYSANAPLDAQGKYVIKENLPPATYKVYLTPPRITKPPMIGGPPVAAVAFNVPDKYQVETMSGLTAPIVAGANTFDFKLD